MTEKGYTSFDLRWIKGPAPEQTLIRDLNFWRTRCFDEGLIGQEASGIGFGNVSIRIVGSRRFVVSGTQTGSLRRLGAQHYVKVIDWCIDENRVVATGPIAASSESLSHAAVYSASPRAGAVLHVHSNALWERLRDRVPTTPKHVQAGTTDMAREIQRLIPGAMQSGGIIVMGGHRDGLLACGVSPTDAAESLLSVARIRS
ncbi:MAG: class II aldolase/adducin family protein [Rhodothermales bacterium]|nr:class II aldolase/adducin family protein [Rhodothermales bacterium]